jgi:hypothetical protein
MAKQKPAWHAILPGGLSPAAFSLDELRAAILVLDDRHLHRVVTEYVRYHNEARPHQGLRQRTPVPAEHPAERKIITLPVLAGLHHEYRRAA